MMGDQFSSLGVWIKKKRAFDPDYLPLDKITHDVMWS